MAWRIEEMSTPARWNIPPSAPKSFWISTTTTAVLVRSMVVGSGFASITASVFIDAISASFGRSATGLQSSGLLPENDDPKMRVQETDRRNAWLVPDQLLAGLDRWDHWRTCTIAPFDS